MSVLAFLGALVLTTSSVPISTDEPPPVVTPEYAQHPYCLEWGAPPLTAPAGSTPPDEVRQIGSSSQGRPLWAEHYGPHDAPQVFVVAYIHGNECAPGFLVEVVRSYPPVDFGVWLIPTLNPDGQAAFTRHNAQDINLNRDGGNRAAPETNALLDFTAEVRPVLTLHVHSPLGWLGWYGPGDYGDGCRDCPDGDVAARVIHGARSLPGASDLGSNGAGRKSRDQWFLWQGQQEVAPGTASVLVEFRPLHGSEAAQAPGRASPATPDAQRAAAGAIWSAVVDEMGQPTASG